MTLLTLGELRTTMVEVMGFNGLGGDLLVHQQKWKCEGVGIWPP